MIAWILQIDPPPEQAELFWWLRWGIGVLSLSLIYVLHVTRKFFVGRIDELKAQNDVVRAENIKMRDQIDQLNETRLEEAKETAVLLDRAINLLQ